MAWKCTEPHGLKEPRPKNHNIFGLNVYEIFKPFNELIEAETRRFLEDRKFVWNLGTWIILNFDIVCLFYNLRNCLSLGFANLLRAYAFFERERERERKRRRRRRENGFYKNWFVSEFKRPWKLVLGISLPMQLWVFIYPFALSKSKHLTTYGHGPTLGRFELQIKPLALIFPDENPCENFSLKNPSAYL